MTTLLDNTMKKPRIEDDKRKRQAFAFLQAILADLREIQTTSNNEHEIKAVLHRVPDPYDNTKAPQNVIIRQADHVFWKTAISELEQEDAPTRMAVVGTPGIGKSITAVCYAIRLLLLRKRRVVYVQRTPERQDDYYMEWIPSHNTTTTIAEEVEIEIHPETLSPTEIPSLSHKSTYYIVDPGKTTTTCNPSARVAARVIIVASSNERHWGGASFEKDDQQSLGGFLRYFPMWSLAQLKAAWPLLRTTPVDDDKVAELYSVFGGIPRYIFAPERTMQQMKEDLQRRVDSLAVLQVRDLVTGQLNRHSGFLGEGQPGIVAFVPLDDDYTDVELKLASTSIVEWMRIRFLDAIWTDLAIYPTPIAWQLLEDYMRSSLQNRIQWNVRPCCFGQLNVAYNHTQQLQSHTLGPCTEKTLVEDCTASVLHGSNGALFYQSSFDSSSHPLCNMMIYRVDSIFYAFQVPRVGKSQDDVKQQTQQHIDALVQRLEIGTHGKELRLYYAVHEAVFDHYVVTNSVSVKYDAVPGVSVFHLRLVKNGLGTSATS